MIGFGNIPAMGNVLLAAWLGLGMAGPGLDTGPFAQGAPLFHPEDPTPEPGPVVYLTFDDGPHPVYTPRMLDVLAAHQAKATFFVVGEMVRRWPAPARRIVDEGHSLQSHAWNHDDLTTLSRRDFMTDMKRTQTELLYTARVQATCMRPPYGAVNPRVERWATQLGLAVELWDVSGLDWTDISSEAMARRVLGRVVPGSVVLLHDGGGPRGRTVSALEIILPSLIGDGYRFGLLCPPNPLSFRPPVCSFSYAWPRARICADPSAPEVR